MSQPITPESVSAYGAMIAGTYRRECPLCATNGPVHDFTRTCCRVRYLLALPSRDARRCTLARWRQEHGAAAADETETALSAAWQQRKHAARHQPSTLAADQRQTNTEVAPSHDRRATGEI